MSLPQSHFVKLHKIVCPSKFTDGPYYMWTFYLRFQVYAIEIMAFQRDESSNLHMLLVSLYAFLLYANQFS